MHKSSICSNKPGYQYWFTQSENSRIEENNEDFIFHSPEEELVLTHIRKTGTFFRKRLHYLTVTEIVELIRGTDGVSIFSRNQSPTREKWMSKRLNFIREKREKIHCIHYWYRTGEIKQAIWIRFHLLFRRKRWGLVRVLCNFSFLYFLFLFFYFLLKNNEC